MPVPLVRRLTSANNFEYIAIAVTSPVAGLALSVAGCSRSAGPADASGPAAPSAGETSALPPADPPIAPTPRVVNLRGLVDRPSRTAGRAMTRPERVLHVYYRHVPISLTTAVLGGEADVETLGGKALRLRIPPGTQHAQVFRLKGHGLTVVNHPEQSGDLYATVDVQMPRDLTPDQRTHFEALQRSGL